MTTDTRKKSEQAYLRMRQMIIERQMLEGERWSIRAVARTLNMSVVPVSEATRKLEADGLIVTRSRSGIRLRSLTKSERAGVLLIREALEVQAARIVAKRYARDPAKAEKLRAMVHDLRECLQKGEDGKAALLDYELHFLLVRWAGNRFFTNLYSRLALLSKVQTEGWTGVWKRKEMSRPGNHLELVEGILSGDEQTAEDAVRRHIHRHGHASVRRRSVSA